MGSLTDVNIKASETFNDIILWDENFDELIANLKKCNENIRIYEEEY